MNDVGRQFERALKNAGLVDFHFHDLRHTAATRMGDAGADPFMLAAILRHSDIRMTARYTHATDEAKRQAVEKLVRPATLGARESHPIPLLAPAVPGAGGTPAVPVNALRLGPAVNGVGTTVVAEKYPKFSNVLATEIKTASGTRRN